MTSQRLYYYFGRASAALLVLLTASFSATATPPVDAGPPQFVTGNLEVVVGDDFENRRSEVLHFLRDQATGERFVLHFDGAAPRGLESGTTVRVLGRALGRDLFLETNTSGETEVTVLQGTTAQASVSGVQNTAVIMVDFPTLPLECTSGEVADIMFTGPDGTTVDNLYQEMSSGQASLDGSVIGPVTLSDGDPGNCDPNGWAVEANSLLASTGVDLSGFPRKVYVLPSTTSCSYAGLGQVGGATTTAWVMRCGIEDVYAHELGHNFGWGHSGTTSNEYGDTSGIMSYSGLELRHANGPHKAQSGWLGARVQDVSTNGDYWVEALSLTDGEAIGPQVLRVPKPDDGTFYFVSYRAAEGFDANLGSGYYRLYVHTHPGTGSSRTTRVAALLEGDSWTDPATDTSFTYLSTNGNSVLARVSFDGTPTGCSVQSPELSVSPSTQSGPAGTALNYSVTLINRDGAGCSDSTFDLGASAPSGWTTSVSPASLTLAPSASGSVTLSVISSSSASAGSNTVTVSASDAAESSHAASASADYQVESSCVAGSPAVAISPSSQSGGAGSTLTYTMSVTNRDSAACSATSFSTSGSPPAGWTMDVSPATLVLDPGQSANAAVAVTAAPDAAAGDYSFSVGANDPVTAGHDDSANGTFTVQASCVSDNPSVEISPIYQSAPAGQALVYSMYVTNRDSAECASTTWDLVRDVPAGLNIDVSAASMTLLPGETATVSVTASSDSGLGVGDYDFKIRAVDADQTGHNNNRVATLAVVEQPNSADSEAPTAPRRLKASLRRGDTAVRLSWQPSTDNVGVAGYRVYRDGGLIATTTNTAFSDFTIVNGATYYVTAYDAAGNESEPSGSITLKSGGGGGKGGGKK